MVPEESVYLSLSCAPVARNWLVSTNRYLARPDVRLDSDPAFVYEEWNQKSDGTPLYEFDTKEYRLAKFREEAKKYFNIEDTIFYYIFTETFLMIDSRVKNSFPSYFAVTQKCQAKDSEGNLLYSECKEGAVIEANYRNNTERYILIIHIWYGYRRIL